MLSGVLAFSYLTSGDSKPAFTQQPKQNPPLAAPTTQPIRKQSPPLENPKPVTDTTESEEGDTYIAQAQTPPTTSDAVVASNEYIGDDSPILQDFGFRIEGDPVAGVPLAFKIVNFREDVTFVLYYGDGNKDEGATLINSHTYRRAGTYAVRLKAYGPRTPENLYASYVLTVKEPGQSPFAHVDGIGLGD
jgi:hypothetical protein